LTAADGIVGDEILTHPFTSPWATRGDETVTYDKSGNITYLKRYFDYTGSGSTPNTHVEEWNYQYISTSNKLQKVNGLTGTGTRNYTYDWNGNLKTDDSRDLNVVYGRGNFPFDLQANSLTIDYLYNASDKRNFKKVVSSTDTHREYYLYDASGRDIGVLDMETGKWTWYAFAADRYAKIEPLIQQPLWYPGDIEASGSALTGVPLSSLPTSYTYFSNMLFYEPTYYIHDHLGSIRLSYKPYFPDCNTPLVEKYRLEYAGDYYPFGKILREFVNDPENIGFQGSRKDEELGQSVYYTQYRHLDVDIAKWWGVDALAGNFPNKSPYAVFDNNPVSLVDIDGLKSNKPDKYQRRFKKEYRKWLQENGRSSPGLRFMTTDFIAFLNMNRANEKWYIKYNEKHGVGPKTTDTGLDSKVQGAITMKGGNPISPGVSTGSKNIPFGTGTMTIEVGGGNIDRVSTTANYTVSLTDAAGNNVLTQAFTLTPSDANERTFDFSTPSPGNFTVTVTRVETATGEPDNLAWNAHFLPTMQTQSQPETFKKKKPKFKWISKPPRRAD
jgi:RHS repeat-associated protein